MSAVSFLILCSLSVVFGQNYTFGSYFANWAQYRAAPYTYQASNLQSIIHRLDQIYYGFIYFCPPAGSTMPYWAVPPYGNCNDASEYQLLSVEPKDASFIPTIVGMKSTNPNLKVLLSIGGWNFPSEYFSKLAASSTATQKFITSVQSWINQYRVDGIDLDWEYPCSPPRSDPVEISCTDFRTVTDAGGKCPDDTTNIVTFLKALKTGLGSGKLVTFASQAAKANEQSMNIKAATPYVDMWHVMSYDYTVSDLPDAGAAKMSPNAPLYNPTNGLAMSISSTVDDYISFGVDPKKIMIGIPYYGHTWYETSLINTNNWQKFGNNGTIQGVCCGPFAQTYGAKYGKGCNMCGTMMFSEIQFGKPTTYYDNTSQSMIGFWNTQGADGWTEAGTWISYNEETSVTAITNYAKTKGLSGVFVFDSSMDSVTSGGQFTYTLTNLIAQTLGGHN
jgi:chitinase